MKPIVITGIGTGIGKTVAAAIITEALQGDYWKPVQAGFENGTDSEWIRSVLSNPQQNVYPESYKFKLAASPHIAARAEGRAIDLDFIQRDLDKLQGAHAKTGNQDRGISAREPEDRHLIIEGAGGLLAPLNENEFAADLFRKFDAGIILVSRNYLGSINHSLLTAAVSRQYGLNIKGWIFNDQYLQYEDEIVSWSGFPKIASIPFCNNVDRRFVKDQAAIIKPALLNLFNINW
jgi:dethiobiotin synthetase